MKALVIGVNRGQLHGLAYKNIDGMEFVAFCDINEEKFEELTANYGVRAYSDYETALQSELPDIVHVVTSPAVPRYTWIEPAARYNVKAIVLEKPYALTPEEKKSVDDAVYGHPEILVIVNHQRRYMDFAIKLRELLKNESLGEIRHIYAQAQGEIMEMGTHIMDLVLMAVGDVKPESIWAAVSGGENYSKPGFNCPDNLIAQIVFPERVRATVEVGIDCVAKPNFSVIQPKHSETFYANRCSLYIYGTFGFLWWREYGDWGYFLYDHFRRYNCRSDYQDDDPVAQSRLTEAIKRDLEDGIWHECEFRKADMGLTCIFGAYKSALLGRRLVEIDFLEPGPMLTQDEWEILRSRLAEG
jgi:predicted dehydrogenase